MSFAGLADWPMAHGARHSAATGTMAVVLNELEPRILILRSPLRNSSDLYWGFAADAANKRFPSGVRTTFALQVLVPSFARKPSMLTWSPCLSVVRLQPCLPNVFGRPPSHSQRAVLPLSSLTSTYSQ